MFWLIIFLLLIAVVIYLWISLPIISGYAAKMICTGLFVSGRTEDEVRQSDLSRFPLRLARVTVDWENQSVSSTVFGLATRKAIYRKGAGCTLINQISEEELRKKDFDSGTLSYTHNSAPAWLFDDKEIETRKAGIDRDALNQVVDNFFAGQSPKSNRDAHAIVVVYDGQVVAERYAPGFDKKTKMCGWSVAKSMTAALIGILVGEGRLNEEMPAPVPEWNSPDDPRNKMTIRDLLYQMSGLRFTENYTKASSATTMLFKKDDMAAFAANQKLKHQPGTFFHYSSGNSNILSRIIRQVVGEQDYASFPYKALFHKIGMFDTVLEPDASGTFVGSSYIQATARDYARFGLLYLNDGVWNGERILPEGWVQKTTTPHPRNPLRNYGYQFWLKGFDEKNPSKQSYPDAPADLFYCKGFGEQYIFIVPSKKLVVVRLGLTLDGSFDGNHLVRDILNLIP